MNKKKLEVAIVGGGITGLSAAFYLQKQAREMDIPMNFNLYEAGNELGGKIQTAEHNGMIIEKGPDSFLKRKMSTIELIKEVGLENELVSNETGKSYILKNRKLHPIPEAAMMGIPTRITPFVKTNLISFKGKMRAACDLVLPKFKPSEDPSVGEFFRYRLGDDLVDSLIEPLLSGIYSNDMDQLSLMATFPNFKQLEDRHRSLILGMRTLRPSGEQKLFLTLKSGLSSLVRAVSDHLPEQSIHLNSEVQSIQKTGNQYVLRLKNGSSQTVDSIILTTPHPITMRLLGKAVQMNQLEVAKTSSVANVSLVFQEDQVKFGQHGTGFVVTKNENCTITACTWTNNKWPHTAPSGKVLLRCYVGRPGDNDIVDRTDEELVRTVLHDLSKVVSMKGEPQYSLVSRWKDSMPQYRPHHLQWVQQVRGRLKEQAPKVYVAGAAYDGVGIGDCIRQGKSVANEAVENLFHIVHA